MPMTIPTLDFKTAERKARKMSIEALRYTINDCREAIAANPSAEKAQGYYQDEIHVYSAELRKREQKGKA